MKLNAAHYGNADVEAEIVDSFSMFISNGRNWLWTMNLRTVNSLLSYSSEEIELMIQE